MKTRREFLEAVMKMANLKDLQQADDAAQAVISLTKAIIGNTLSQKIAEVSPPDLRKGWESIEPSPVDYSERDELLLETGEVQELAVECRVNRRTTRLTRVCKNAASLCFCTPVNAIVHYFLL